MHHAVHLFLSKTIKLTNVKFIRFIIEMHTFNFYVSKYIYIYFFYHKPYKIYIYRSCNFTSFLLQCSPPQRTAISRVCASLAVDFHPGISRASRERLQMRICVRRCDRVKRHVYKTIAEKKVLKKRGRALDGDLVNASRKARPLHVQPPSRRV